jgi:hypothetical protein
MGIKEILDKEGGRYIYLYKKGVFWTAYQQSALLLFELKPLQLRSNYVKAVGKEVVRVGFPDKTRVWLETLLGAFVFENDIQGFWICPDHIKMPDLEKKLSELSHSDSSLLNNRSKPLTVEEQVVKKIKNWHISEKTPLEAMLFLRDLQLLLNEHENK